MGNNYFGKKTTLGVERNKVKKKQSFETNIIKTSATHWLLLDKG